jgi:hypothetical protein
VATWIEDVEEALPRLGGQGRLADIYAEVKAMRTNQLPRTWQAIVRREIEYDSTDSEAYDNGPDVFYSVDGIGGGVWGLRSVASAAVRTTANPIDRPYVGARRSSSKPRDPFDVDPDAIDRGLKRHTEWTRPLAGTKRDRMHFPCPVADLRPLVACREVSGSWPRSRA